MEIETIFGIMLLACHYGWCIWIEIRDKRIELEKQRARRIEQKKIVTARFKNERVAGFWKCRYFSLHKGDTVGFLRQKPSSERIKAKEGSLDPELNMYELIELESCNDNAQLSI